VSRPHETHRARAEGVLLFYIVTVSSSRYARMKAGSEFGDASGDLVERAALENSHKVLRRKLIPDDRTMIRSEVKDFLRSKGDVLVFAGGTGMSPRDVTVEAVVPFFEKELVGFGELLRSVSYKKIGSAAMLTRATAGTAKGRLIVCLPGSPDAVGTAMQTFVSEFPHILAVAREA
jgi:molybdenum cofactor biosynthesis protein B